MSARLFVFVTVIFSAFFISSCATGPGHFIGSTPGDSLQWGIDRESVITGIDDKIGGASQYPFLISYRYRWVSNTAGVERDVAWEKVEYFFNTEGQLYQVKLSYSAIPIDTNYYTRDVVERADRLLMGYEREFGTPDNEWGLDLGASKLYQVVGDGTVQEGDVVTSAALWENVPYGKPAQPTRIELGFTKLGPTVRFSESYTNLTLAPEFTSVFQDIVEDNYDALSRKEHFDANEVMSCIIVSDTGSDLVRRDFLEITPLYLASVLSELSHRSELISFLIEQGADVNHRALYNHQDGPIADYPLAKLTAQKETDLVRMLLEAGADPDLESKNYRNMSSRQIAEKLKLEDILAFM